MRILTLRIENLNSLRGTHLVEFDQPPLSHAGLFAIVGETGAGKTTLLDAITLALYGRIDRDPMVRGGGKEIMSYGTGSCYAELEFTTASGTYRSRWERSRAYGKATGNLQAAERAVARLEENGRDWKYLSTKSTEIDEIIPRITGLDYHRFTRSVMLTQGEFARFLKANASERAGLLENITGTEVYRELSKAAHERNKLAAQELEVARKQLDDLQLLTEIERRLITEELAAREKTTAESTQALNQARSQILLYRQLREWRTELERDREQLISLDQRWKERAEIRAQLDLLERLRPYLADLRQYRELGDRIRRSVAAEPQREAEHKERRRSVARAKEQLVRAAEKLREFVDKKPERSSYVNRAAELETLRGRDEKRQKELNVALKRLRLEREREARKMRKLEQTIREKAEQLGILAERAAVLFGAESTAAGAEDWNLLLVKTSATLESKIQTLQTELNREKATRRLAALAQRSEELQQQEKSLTLTVKRAAEAAQKSREQRDYLVEVLEQQQQSEAVAHLRRGLEDGAPCPVCGALDHPALAHWKPPSENAVNKTKKKLDEEKGKLDNLQEELRKGERSLDKIGTEVKALLAQIEENQRLAREEFGASATTDRSGESPEEELRQARDKKRALLEFGEVLTASQADRKERRQAETALAKTQKDLAHIDTALTKTEAELTKTEAELEEREKEHARLLKGLTVAEARERMESLERQYRDAETAAREALEAQQRLATESEERINQQRNVLSNDQRREAELKGDLSGDLRELGFADPEAAITSLLPPAEETRLRTEIAELDRQLHAIRDRISRGEQRIKKREKEVESLPPEIELSTALEELEARQSDLQRRIGAAQEQLRNDDRNRRRAGQLTEVLPLREAEARRWARLNELIGQADGAKFSRFAQGLTLARLVQLANRQLTTLSGRYRIDRVSGAELELEIIDTYQADNRRPTSTLSGGESFLVSLALALGLSDLAGGRTQIHSLFIDEGFGTLDQNALDTVVSTLENLRASGKTIGLISHVPALRERIHHQIVLEPRGDGFSSLRIV